VRRRLPLLILFFLLTPLTAWAGTIAGAVIGEDAGPVGFVKVEVAGTDRQAVSGEDGRFVIAALPAGKYILRIQPEGFQPIKTPVNVPADGEVAVTITL